MSALILTLMAWIAAETGWHIAQPPRVEFVSHEELVDRAFGPETCPTASVSALYEHATGVIYLDETWDAADPSQVSILVHELVPHLQSANKIEAPCRQALESQAYGLQVKWLVEQGVADPYGKIGVDAFTIAVLSLCPQSE